MLLWLKIRSSTTVKSQAVLPGLNIQRANQLLITKPEGKIIVAFFPLKDFEYKEQNWTTLWYYSTVFPGSEGTETYCSSYRNRNCHWVRISGEDFLGKLTRIWKQQLILLGDFQEYLHVKKKVNKKWMSIQSPPLNNRTTRLICLFLLYTKDI